MTTLVYQAHRGVSSECPENTMAAFKRAKMQEYTIIESDPAYTLDEQIVMLHDKTINRTAVYPNGDSIPQALMITDLTLEQVLAYDFGLGYAKKYRGEKIPLLSQVLSFVKENQMLLKLDNKIEAFPEKINDKIFSLCESYEDCVGFTCKTLDFVKTVRNRLKNAFIHYDGEVTPSVLSELSALVPKEKLCVWLPLKNADTLWVNVEFAEGNTAQKIKEVARLGLWILKNNRELNTAVQWGADVIETAGQLKPIQNKGVVVDCHSHSENSHDSRTKPEDSVRAAKEKGLNGITITDHCDIEFSQQADVLTPIKNSFKQAKENGIFAGIELGEAIYEPKTAKIAAEMLPYDLIVGSVHAVRMKDFDYPYSRIIFSEQPKAFSEKYFDMYLDDVLETVKTCNFDVLAHLTCPLRYMNGRYALGINVKNYEIKITQILQEIIRRGIALEVNSSCIGGNYSELLPERRIIEKYKNLGGYLVTFGSDAHKAEKIGYEKDFVIDTLKQIGFDAIYYYKNRIPIPCTL